MSLMSDSMPFTEWQILQSEKRGQLSRDLWVAKIGTWYGQEIKIWKIPQPIRMLTLRRTMLSHLAGTSHFDQSNEKSQSTRIWFQGYWSTTCCRRGKIFLRNHSGAPWRLKSQCKSMSVSWNYAFTLRLYSSFLPLKIFNLQLTLSTKRAFYSFIYNSKQPELSRIYIYRLTSTLSQERLT